MDLLNKESKAVEINKQFSPEIEIASSLLCL
jgi:hypothetical protein